MVDIAGVTDLRTAFPASKVILASVSPRWMRDYRLLSDDLAQKREMFHC